MANLPESPEWHDGIFQLETTTPVKGGTPAFNEADQPTDGHDNAAPKQLADRTQWLRGERVLRFATVSDMQSEWVAGLPDGAQAIVKGYHTANDGGGGLFYYAAANATPLDGGFVFETLDNPSGRWLRQKQDGSVSVKWFGARGDGATADSVAIQAACDYCRDNGNHPSANVSTSRTRRRTGLYFPQGKYLCHGIVWEAFGEVIGDSAVLQLDDPSSWVLAISTLTVQGSSKVQGITFCHSTSVPDRYAAASKTNTVLGMVTDSIEDYNTFAGVGLIVASSNTTVQGCGFVSFGVGIMFYTGASGSSGGVFPGTNAAYGGSVSGCAFHYNLYSVAGMVQDGLSNYVGNISFISNYFSVNYKADYCFSHSLTRRITCISNTHDSHAFIGIFCGSALVEMTNCHLEPGITSESDIDVDLSDITNSNSPVSSVRIKSATDAHSFAFYINRSRLRVSGGRYPGTIADNRSHVVYDYIVFNDDRSLVRLDETSQWDVLSYTGYRNNGFSIRTEGTLRLVSPHTIALDSSTGMEGYVYRCPTLKLLPFQGGYNTVRYPLMDNTAAIAGTVVSKTVEDVGPLGKALLIQATGAQRIMAEPTGDEHWADKTSGFRVETILLWVQTDGQLLLDDTNVHTPPFHLKKSDGWVQIFGITDVANAIANGKTWKRIRLLHPDGEMTYYATGAQCLWFERWQDVLEFWKSPNFDSLPMS